MNANEDPAEPKKKPPKSAPVASAAKTVEGKVVRPPSKVGLVRAGEDGREDFGQTYPTPREDSAGTATVAIQTDPATMPRNRRVAEATTPKREPVAYYLPMANSSPIKIGAKELKKSAGEEGALGKENRSILANYVAGLDASAVDIDTRRKREERRRRREEKKEEEEMREAQERPLLTLRDALEAQRPDFLTRCERRQAVLRRAREQRLEVEERRRRWLAEVAKMPPEMRARAPQPDYPPVKVERLFRYAMLPFL